MTDPTREVLVVDDLPEIGDFFVGLLAHLKGFDIRVRAETSPAEAMALLRERRFDLVISDFRMKDHDGIEVLAAARSASPSTGRILMTGYNEIPTPMERIREAQVDAYVQKPLKSQDLLMLIFHFLHNDKDAIDACRRAAREMETLGSREERGSR
jgi:DNA-binding NtrC family response regulator